MERTQDIVVQRQVKQRRDWAKWGLGVYFVIFLVFLYAPMILMAILSFQGYDGGVTFPFSGPGEPRLVAVDLRRTGSAIIYTNADDDPRRRSSARSGSASRQARSSRSWLHPLDGVPAPLRSGPTASPSTSSCSR